MKAHNFLFLSIIIIFVNYSAQKYLTLTTHKSNRFTSNNGAQDLIGKRVECPNRGVLKNFVLKKQGKEYYYNYYLNYFHHYYHFFDFGYYLNPHF